MLPGYRLQHIPRPPFVRSRGGGVGFYIKQNINARTSVHPEDPQHKSVEQMWLMVTLKGDQFLHVVKN
ncbi:unnamed protein product [Leptidea sinapis]|uniref:Uncharacterized protein n=1 Tax=Leptidea sinapis TaxID=189913 RepID=A0A5E4QGX6_9NEOP|nr:unnamed protein product [Leptidea sinapis]